MFDYIVNVFCHFYCNAVTSTIKCNYCKMGNHFVKITDKVGGVLWQRKKGQYTFISFSFQK